MLNKLLARFGYERKESRAYSALSIFGLDTPVWTPRDYDRLTKAGYQLNADVYACVNLIARSAKQVPWIVYTKEGGGEVAVNHPLLKLLRKPNERDTESDFKEAAVAYLMLSGNEYIERSGGTETTPPVFLYAHRPDRFRVIRGNRRQMVSGYEYKAGGDPVRFEPWEIMHLRLFNPLDDFYGMSPIEAAAYTIDNSNESSALYKKLLQKGYPPGAVMVKGADYTDEQIKDLKLGLRRSSENGDILLLQDAEWKEMGFKPVDASIFQGKLFSKRDIAAVFGVPSGMIGDTQVKTYANSREERRSLYTEGVIPALTKLRDGLNNWLSPLYGNAYIDIDKDAIDALAEDREVQAKRVHMLWTSDLIKRNEGRAELKYDAVPEDEDGYHSEVVKRADEIPDAPDSEELPDELEGGLAGRTRRSATSNPAILRNGSRASGIMRADHRDASLKAFNLLSEEQKDNHWKAVDNRRELWYARVSADVEERFALERNAVLKAYRDGGEPSALKAVTRQEDAWSALYRRTYFAVSEDFGRRTLQSIKSDGYDHEVKFDGDIFTRTVLEWLSSQGALRVVGVLDTTKDSIRRELIAGVQAGEGSFQLAKRLESMYRDFGVVRAERIARTEVLGASELGSFTAAKSTNLPLRKHWIATLDSRVRDTHSATNGQTRRMDEPFSVGGYKMNHPGDSSLGASSEEIIQCRCTTSFSVDRG